MKKLLKILFLPAVCAVVLSSCNSSPTDMQKFDSEAANCEPIRNIIDLSSKQSINMLVIPVRKDDGSVKEYKGVVTWLVDSVTEVVKDASLKIYLKIALNLDFRFLVAMMMTLSVILFAASVLLGLIQANGYNALMFVFKLVVIYHLTINYFYFYTYVIQSFEALVTDAMMFSSLTFSDFLAVDPTIICLGLFGQACDIASIIGTLFFGDSNAIQGAIGSLFGSSATGAIKKFYLFSAFDATISHFFDVRQWKVIMALMGTGLGGAFWGLMMALMHVLYLFAVIEAVKVYLLSYIARWALYGIGPIFISFALFNQTRSLFSGWLTQLISFTLQPVLLFIFLGMFQTIINGFISQMYVSIGGPSGSYTVTQACPTWNWMSPIDQWVWTTANGQPDLNCSSMQCDASEWGCDCTSSPGNCQKYVLISTAWASGMCVKWDKFGVNSGGDQQYWYRLCHQVGGKNSCMEGSTMKPEIPIDIWMVMAIIVICYLMMAMCRWVVEVANTLADGAVAMSGVKIMGWDNLKQGIGGGFKGLFTQAPRSSPGKPVGTDSGVSR